ncbi:LOW QUALITY PROTEIN: hypothetical protein PHMEG_00024029 [Phytophthora megakarya]|uniref:Uncharacterized protein n=1 Tax=Phytophthora megakarya TaxID=4795 RepID=A0A225VG74_9STRA|nr:LOW QUALITY PROTEIN: hypothetical protein PHMEG_00024029 [Phytophthora megakarya]
MPKRERSPPTSPPQFPPLKALRSDRPVSPPPNQDRPEVEGSEGQRHQDQPEFEGPDDQEHQDQPEIEVPDDQDHQDQPEFEGPDDQEHQDQPEFEGPDDQELEDKREIPGGGGGTLVITIPLLRITALRHLLPRLHRVAVPRLLLLHLPSLLVVGQVVALRGVVPQSSYIHPSIPHYSDLKLFTAAEIYPWDPIIMGTVPIIAMIQATLTKRMPIPINFMFPYRVPPVRAPQPVVGYCSGLITGANVLALMATEPWRMLRRRRPTPLTFDHNLHRWAQTPLWRITVGYAALEEDNMITYWESTHYLKITTAMTCADADLFTYHADRRQRRIRAGESWRKLLGDVVLMMRAMWADIDILLDPYFLHLPTKQDRARWYPGSVSRAANLAQPKANLPEPIALITARIGLPGCQSRATESEPPRADRLDHGPCDQADPWRNHFRDPGSVHPSRNIPRLVNKFNPPVPPPAAP